MNEHPFAIEMIISEDSVKIFRDLIDQESVESKVFTITSGLHCQLNIFPNGTEKANLGEMWIFFHVVHDSAFLKMRYSLSIESVNWRKEGEYISEDLGKFEKGFCCCKTEDLFNLSKQFLVDGKLIIKFEGIFKVFFFDHEGKSSFQVLKKCMDYRNLWDIGFEDFIIVVDEKEIKVHKNVLAVHSPVFCAMFKSSMNEAIENRVNISDFSYDIVLLVVKLCYNQIYYSEISLCEAFLIIKFADKYDMKVVKDNVELFLSDKITPLNFCEIVNTGISVNALVLRSKCIERFNYYLLNRVPIYKLEHIDNGFLVDAVKDFFWQKYEI